MGELGFEPSSTWLSSLAQSKAAGLRARRFRPTVRPLSLAPGPFPSRRRCPRHLDSFPPASLSSQEEHRVSHHPNHLGGLENVLLSRVVIILKAVRGSGVWRDCVWRWWWLLGVYACLGIEKHISLRTRWSCKYWSDFSKPPNTVLVESFPLEMPITLQDIRGGKWLVNVFITDSPHV